MGFDLILLGPTDETDLEKYARLVRLEIEQHVRKKETLVCQLLHVNRKISELEEILQNLERKERKPS